MQQNGMLLLKHAAYNVKNEVIPLFPFLYEYRYKNWNYKMFSFFLLLQHKC